MKIRTLRRMMIGRTIAQKDETISIGAKEGRELIAKGYAVEVKDEPTKPKKTKAAPTKDADEKAD